MKIVLQNLSESAYEEPATNFEIILETSSDSDLSYFWWYNLFEWSTGFCHQCIVHQQLYSCWHFSAPATSFIARTGVGYLFLGRFDWLCRFYSWSELFALNSCQTENSCLQNICFHVTSLVYAVLKLFCLCIFFRYTWYLAVLFFQPQHFKKRLSVRWESIQWSFLFKK